MNHPQPHDYLIRKTFLMPYAKFTVTSTDAHGFEVEIAHFDSEEDAKLFLEMKRNNSTAVKQVMELREKLAVAREVLQRYAVRGNDAATALGLTKC